MIMIDKEIWKFYKDTTINSIGRKSKNGGIYEVSNLGRVRKNGELLELGLLNSGYLACAVGLVHRMVAETFIPNTENKPCIDHIDDNKTNNVVTNLRWVTYSENNGKESHVEKQRNTMTGRTLSEEHIEKIKEFQKIFWTEEKKEEHKKRCKGINKGNTAVKGYKSIIKDNIVKLVPENEIEIWLKEGWKYGGYKRTEEQRQNQKKAMKGKVNLGNTAVKGYKHINNGIESKMKPLSEIDEWLNKGWTLGRLKINKAS